MHPSLPQVAAEAADPESYAAQEILSTLAENRKWLNEMDETDNTSMRIFEYTALFFLVMLLKFATDNTREIYVRLTSPVRYPGLFCFHVSSAHSLLACSRFAVPREAKI